MGRILQLLAFFSICMPVAAQEKSDTKTDEPLYECIYTYTINGRVQETYNTVLQIGRTFTRFYDYSAYAVDSLSFIPEASEKEMGILRGIRQTALYFFDAEVFQNMPSGKMTVVQESFPDQFSYEEDLGSFEWELDNVTDTICGYECYKAITNYGGRRWTVWYTPEIPNTAGPWKFNGLPGLILAAKDSEEIHDFKAIIFRKGMTPISFPEDPKIHKSTRENVLKAKLRSEKNVEAGIKPDKSTVWDYYIVMNHAGDRLEYYNGVAMRNRPNGYIPLELE